MLMLGSGENVQSTRVEERKMKEGKKDVGRGERIRTKNGEEVRRCLYHTTATELG